MLAVYRFVAGKLHLEACNFGMYEMSSVSDPLHHFQRPAVGAQYKESCWRLLLSSRQQNYLSCTMQNMVS